MSDASNFSISLKTIILLPIFLKGFFRVKIPCIMSTHHELSGSGTVVSKWLALLSRGFIASYDHGKSKDQKKLPDSILDRELPVSSFYLQLWTMKVEI